ncbi:MAG: phage holin family protein [Campylobacteraceae bacterium]
MSEIKEKLIFWAWVCFVACVAGVLSFIKKNRGKEQTKKEFIAGMIVGVITSMLVAYITFQIAFFYFENENISVAISGIAAWMGADALVALQGFILNLTNKYYRKD